MAAGSNAEFDQSVLKPGGTIAIYANDGGVPFAPDVRTNMGLNTRYQFILLYTVGWDRIANAAAALNQAIDDGAFRIGEQAGLRFTASTSMTRPPLTTRSRAEPSERSSSRSPPNGGGPNESGALNPARGRRSRVR